MTDARPTLTLLVPCYREAARIEGLVEAVGAWGGAHPETSYELLCVDDGSPDDTAECVRRHARGDPRVRVLPLPENVGKGAALRAGVAAARGEVVVFLDADLAVDLSHVDPALAAVEEGAEVVIGSRALPASEVPRPQGMLRRTLGRAYRALAVAWLGLDVTDVTCGFKAFPRNVALSLFGRSEATRWGLDAEVLYLARREGLTLVEQPVCWLDGDASTVRLGRDMFGALRELAAVRRRHRHAVTPARVTPAS